MVSITVIISTLGKSHLKNALNSLKQQTFKDFEVWIVPDGPIAKDNLTKLDIQLESNMMIIDIPQNTGADGWNGHRIYAAMTFLCNSKFISFLDDDNIVYPNHLETLFELFKNNDKLDWSYCLRNVWKNDWSEGIPDLGESIGFLYHTMISKDDHLVDTSCFLIKKDIAMKCIHQLVKPFRGVNNPLDECDRAFTKQLGKYKNKCTKQFTLQYSCGNTEKSVQLGFFEKSNKWISDEFKGRIPWKRSIDINKDFIQKIIN